MTADPSRTILVVDDEPTIRAVLDLLLRRAGYRVLVASQGRQAVELYRTRRETVSLVLLDVCMPGLDGPATLAELRRIDPDVVACFMSGYTDRYDETDLLRAGASGFLHKPFHLDDFLRLVEQLVPIRAVS